MKDNLNQYLQGIRGVSYRPYDLKEGYDSNSYYLFRSNNIKNGKVVYEDVQIVNQICVSDSQKLMPKDIIVCMSNGSRNLVGKNAQFNEDISNYCVGAFCAAFRANEKIDADYSFQLFQSQIYQKQIDVTLAGSAINNLKPGDILNFEFNLPPLPQQLKIAKILSTCDTVIAKTEESIAKYQAIKQGMMHDLFTRGIDLSTGKLRPKYQDAPELYKESELGMIPKDWEVKRLEECVEVKGEYGVNAAAVDFHPSLYTYLRITDISEDGYFIQEGKKSVDQWDAKNFILEDGDIVFARTGNSTGKTYLYVPEDGELVFAGFLIRFKPAKGKLDSRFLKFITETPYYWNWVSIYSARTGQPGINGNEYGQFRIALPEYSEQVQIAQRLHSMNEKILSEKESVYKYYKVKSGLMQDLLSGKVEVSVSQEEKIIKA